MILGPVGLNLGAGMSGGVVYVHDPELRLPLRLNDQLVIAERVDGFGPDELRFLLERHARYTGSQRAADLVAAWDTEAGWFWRVAPRPRADEALVSPEAQAVASS